MMRRASVRLSALALALGLIALIVPQAAAAPKHSGPTLSLGGGDTAAMSLSGAKGKSQDATHIATGGSVDIHAASLDPSIGASLYKAVWTEEPGFTGWKYLYYRGYSPATDGTLHLREDQDAAGAYRFRICQYVESRKGWDNVCSDYEHMVVS